VDARDALVKALQVLEEERVRQTLTYSFVSKTWPRALYWQQQQLQSQGYTPGLAGVMALAAMRKESPRLVEENATLWEFKSGNFDLLLKILGFVPDNERRDFLKGLIEVMFKAVPIRKVTTQIPFPNWEFQTSSLSLLIEFAVRTGHLAELLEATKLITMPSPGLVMMLMELAEMIALNFTLFSESQMANLPNDLSHLFEIAERQTNTARGKRTGPMVDNPHYKQGYQDAGNEIVKMIIAIREQCRQASFFYLKGALQDSPNLEIENDRLKVIGFIDSLGFNPTLTASLNEAEKNYRSDATPFELKDCMNHLRSFMENLHIEAAQSVAVGINDSNPPNRWGKVVAYLKTNGVISVQEEMFVTSLYTLMSDEGVHPLIAEREYVRIRRNMTYEYGLMFLTVLDKKNLRGRVGSS
jgi:hypothetical protein